MGNSFHLAFCDGACSGNPGPGGWGVVVRTADGRVIERGGAEAPTTNNRMEITAVAEVLRILLEIKEPLSNERPKATIYTDSRYVIQGITKWIHGWKRNGWKTATGSAVSNQELWEALLALWNEMKAHHRVALEYVPGHSGVVGNERADEIATAFAKDEKIELYRGDAAVYPRDLENLTVGKTPAKKSSSGKALGYLSLLEGKAIRHRNWGACEKRVKGKAKALFRKYTSADEEKQILTSWGVFPHDVKEE